MRTSIQIKTRAALVVATGLFGMSSVAFADPPWVQYGQGYGGGYGYEQPHYGRRCHEEPRVVEQHYYYYPQQQGYAAPPPVIYQQVPVYQQYSYSPPSYSYGGGYNRGYRYGGGGYPRGDRVLSSAVLGAAGGFIGSQIGHGSGRAAATAAGAVAGWVLGDRMGGW